MVSSETKAQQAVLAWILEDDQDIRSTLVFLAQSQGYEVVELCSLGQAWQCLEDLCNRRIDSPDLIVSDFQLGDGPALEWLIRVRNDLPQVRMVCLSAGLTNPIRKTFSVHGIPFMDKPVTLEQVFEIFVTCRD